MIRDSLAGALAGFVATAPMTAAMTSLHRRLPWYERYALPPRQITMNVASTVGLRKHLSEPQRKGLTLIAHYGYGSAMGAIYGPAAASSVSQPITANMANGALFGLGVWSASYLGLLPALDILKPATKHPLRRNLLMIGAHVLWGASVGALFHSIHARLPAESPHGD
jgi:uncharacterized membrane protein YagU involved in acid resistance